MPETDDQTTTGEESVKSVEVGVKGGVDYGVKQAYATYSKSVKNGNEEFVDQEKRTAEKIAADAEADLNPLYRSSQSAKQ